MHAESRKTVNLALFDFDGTLCRKDSFTGFIFYALSKRHIAKQGIKILPWIQAYYLKLYPAHAMRPKLFKAMFKHVAMDELFEMGNRYAQTVLSSLDPQLYAQLRQHQTNGDHVVIVSASVDLYLKPIARALGVELICTEIDISPPVYNGLLSTPDCSCKQKRLRVLQQYCLKDYRAIYAYGNSDEDLEMLDLADYAFMVGKDQSLPTIYSTPMSALH